MYLHCVFIYRYSKNIFIYEYVSVFEKSTDTLISTDPTIIHQYHMDLGQWFDSIKERIFLFYEKKNKIVSNDKRMSIHFDWVLYDKLIKESQIHDTDDMETRRVKHMLRNTILDQMKLVPEWEKQEQQIIKSIDNTIQPVKPKTSVLWEKHLRSKAKEGTRRKRSKNRRGKKWCR